MTFAPAVEAGTDARRTTRHSQLVSDDGERVYKTSTNDEWRTEGEGRMGVRRDIRHVSVCGR